MVVYVLFFFEHLTAYMMVVCYLSADVCSFDLREREREREREGEEERERERERD